jgi:hypothetical protein
MYNQKVVKYIVRYYKNILLNYINKIMDNSYCLNILVQNQIPS